MLVILISTKKSFHDLDKEDGIDAYVLADYARVGRTKASLSI